MHDEEKDCCCGHEHHHGHPHPPVGMPGQEVHIHYHYHFDGPCCCCKDEDEKSCCCEEKHEEEESCCCGHDHEHEHHHHHDHDHEHHHHDHDHDHEHEHEHHHDHDHDHDHEHHHDHDHEHGHEEGEIEVYNHDLAAVGSFQVTVMAGLEETKEKLTGILNDLADWVKGIDGMIGHIKAYIENMGPGYMLSITEDEVSEKTNEESKFQVTFAVIVFNVSLDDLEEKLTAVRDSLK